MKHAFVCGGVCRVLICPEAKAKDINGKNEEMRKNVCFYYCLALLALTAFSGAHAQQVFKTTPSPSVIGYLEYVPQDYNSNSDKYPIVIFLHGLGERGPNSMDPAVLEGGIGAVAKNGPPKHVKNGQQFPFILISPQLKNNYGDWSTAYVMDVINYVKTYLRVDEKRIYLTGLSLGGGGTWWVSQDQPKLFAAIAPVCGSRNTTSKACQIAAENLPVWAFHGDSDSTVPYSRSVNMVNAINACSPTPNPKALLTTYVGVNHNCWDRAYMPDHSVHNPNVYEWMTSYTNTINAGNKIPQANAGSDVTVTLPNGVSITGSGTDTDGSIASYTWTQISGPSTATLSGATAAKVTASNLVAGVYVFRLRVTDNGGEGDSDYVKVTVNASTNIAPVANAGADKDITLPVNTVTLTGTGTDADGTIASYAWTKVSGGAATLTGASTATLTAASLVEGAYTFRLTVTDNGGATKSDDVNVTVSQSLGANEPPVADAGSNKVVTLPVNNKVLVGDGVDTDGTIVAYAWTKVSGPSCTLNDATTTRLNVTNITSGNYVFRLTITDNDGATATDDVSVMFNYTPVANAGADVTLTLPSNTTVLHGSATDMQGSIASYTWTKVSGPAATLTNDKTADLSLSGLVAGTYSFQLQVKDNQGTKANDVTTVIVLPVTTSQARMASPDTEVATLSVEETTPVDSTATEAHQPISLTDWNVLGQQDYSVVIFNDAGRKIYAGNWTQDSYYSVFRNEGLYFYNIFQHGQRVDTGKVFIKI